MARVIISCALSLLLNLQEDIFYHVIFKSQKFTEVLKQVNAELFNDHLCRQTHAWQGLSYY